jgi:hypothetical protein
MKIGTYNYPCTSLGFPPCMHHHAQANMEEMMETATTKRQRNASNILQWIYFQKVTGEPIGLRSFSHHDPANRYEIQANSRGWEVIFCTWEDVITTDGRVLVDEPTYKSVKRGTLLECMEAAELHDERLGEAFAGERD